MRSGKKVPRVARVVIVNDSVQKGYRYSLIEPEGKNFDPAFSPQLTPKQMLALGVFGGAYLRDCMKEFPRNWFLRAKFATGTDPDPALNYFKVNASQSLSEWRKKGWIYKDDPRGWFQWYCRYYAGRRIPDEDARQIKRWRAFARHASQVTMNCAKGDHSCRRVQRQALLHWAYDSRKM
jgi:hypothetical protein